MTDQDKLSSFLDLLHQSKLQASESKIIGEMLFEFFETEKALDNYISAWFFPRTADRKNILRDDVILYTPLSRKLNCAENHDMLNSSTIKKYRKIAELRNSLAHRRSENQRISKIITESMKDQFIQDCQTIRKDIEHKIDNVIIEFKDSLRKEYIEIAEDIRKAILSTKDSKRCQA